MSSIYDWSVVADNNGNVDSDIDFTEGQTPGTLNNSARAVMKRNAEFVKDIAGALAAGGTANAITVTANSAFTAYADGLILSFTAAADNTGATTLNVNAIGTKAVRKMTTSGDAALIGGEIQEDGIYVVQYSSAANSAAGGWLLVNPTIIQDLTTTDNAIARFDGTAGKLQNSGVTIDDSNNISGVAVYNGQELSLDDTSSDTLAPIATIRDRRSTSGANVNQVMWITRQSTSVPVLIFGNDGNDQGIIAARGSGGLRIGNLDGTTNNLDEHLSFTATGNATANGNWTINGTVSASSYGAISGTTINTSAGGTIGGNLNVSGTLSKGAGTFNIEHPLFADKRKRLVHGFVEAPRYDLIYRGIIDLVDGEAVVDIDEASNMTSGTFEALSTNAVVCSLHNQDGFCRVMSGPISGGRFEIIAENELCRDAVAWVVIAERNDAFVKAEDDNCDAYGRLIPEQDQLG